jgi:hypothetical protein
MGKKKGGRYEPRVVGYNPEGNRIIRNVWIPDEPPPPENFPEGDNQMYQQAFNFNLKIVADRGEGKGSSKEK